MVSNEANLFLCVSEILRQRGLPEDSVFFESFKIEDLRGTREHPERYNWGPDRYPSGWAGCWCCYYVMLPEGRTVVYVGETEVR
jgi:hypothetical protein